MDTPATTMKNKHAQTSKKAHPSERPPLNDPLASPAKDPASVEKGCGPKDTAKSAKRKSTEGEAVRPARENDSARGFRASSTSHKQPRREQEHEAPPASTASAAAPKKQKTSAPIDQTTAPKVADPLSKGAAPSEQKEAVAKPLKKKARREEKRKEGGRDGGEGGGRGGGDGGTEHSAGASPKRSSITRKARAPSPSDAEPSSEGPSSSDEEADGAPPRGGKGKSRALVFGASGDIILGIADRTEGASLDCLTLPDEFRLQLPEEKAERAAKKGAPDEKKGAGKGAGAKGEAAKSARKKMGVKQQKEIAFIEVSAVCARLKAEWKRGGKVPDPMSDPSLTPEEKRAITLKALGMFAHFWHSDHTKKRLPNPFKENPDRPFGDDAAKAVHNYVFWHMAETIGFENPFTEREDLGLAEND